jgi:hypothetical protein
LSTVRIELHHRAQCEDHRRFLHDRGFDLDSYHIMQTLQQSRSDPNDRWAHLVMPDAFAASFIERFGGEVVIHVRLPPTKPSEGIEVCDWLREVCHLDIGTHPHSWLSINIWLPELEAIWFRVRWPEAQLLK